MFQKDKQLEKHFLQQTLLINASSKAEQSPFSNYLKDLNKPRWRKALKTVTCSPKALGEKNFGSIFSNEKNAQRETWQINIQTSDLIKEKKSVKDT